MKLPNGYGSVYKLSGNRRKPWAARKTAGFNDKGQPRYVFIGYYRTRQDALQGLAEYNGYNCEGNPKDTTLRAVYEALGELPDNYRYAWKNFHGIEDTPLCDLNLSRLQAVFDHCGRPRATQKNMKIVLSKIFTYAVRHEFVKPEKASAVKWIEIKADYSRKVTREVFTDEEIEALWKGNIYEKIPLLMIYTGLRIDELLSLRREDVDTCFHVRKAKTPAGVRDVPIPSKIRPVVDEWLAKGTDYLITTKRGCAIDYASLRRRYWSSSHKPHDCRHTCATKLAEAGIDRRVINAILGHKGKDLAEEVYTHIGYETMLSALEKICS